MVVVPKEAVSQVVDDCAAIGVRALIVISAGYAEEGAEGRRLQEALVEKVRGHGMRLVGPNCLGLMNTYPENRFNASFSPIFPPVGRIAMSSQSGALGLAILGFTKQLNLGLSKFISIGNKADVTGNDLLQYWEGDPHTDMILLYLESFGNPRRFARIARRVSRSKPIVAVKSGRTTAGTTGGRFSHRRPGRQRCGCRGPFSPDRSDSGRDLGRDVRPGGRAGKPTAAPRPAGSHCDQCRRPGNPLRRYL